MKLIILAFILSLSLHILFFKNYKTEKIEDKNLTSKDTKNSKSSLRYVKLQPKLEPKPKKVETKKIEKPKIKKRPKNFTKAVKPKEIKKREVVKKPKKIIKDKSPNTKAIITEKKPIKPQKRRESIEKRNLENFLLAEPIPLDKELLDDITKSYINLYGKEYESFTKIQKVYLQNNIKSIVNTIRRYYKFPYIARKLRKNDQNIVEFFLHPNGDITGLKIVVPGEYSFYDESILETIEIAYKDFPKPKEITKIKIRGIYRVY